MRIKYLLLLGLLFVFSDCQKDDLSVQEETQIVESISNHISGEDAPNVINYLDRLFNTEGLKIGQINLPFDKNLIDKKTIAAVNDSETGYTNFSFAVKRKKKDNHLFQVVVTEYGENDFSDPYVFQFRFDDAFRKKLNEGEADWSEYTGSIYPYSLNGAADVLAKNLPCPDIGPGSSGGGGTTPDTGGDGSTSGGVPDSGGNSGDEEECYYIFEEDADGNVTIEISCDGPFIMVLMDDGDCPDPPEAPIGVIEPEEDPLDIAANEWVIALKAQDKIDWALDRLKNDAGFQALAAMTFEQPAGTFMLPGEWNKIAAEAYAVAFKKFGGTTTGSLIDHYDTFKDISETNFWDQVTALATELSETYERVISILPQNSDEWLSMGGMFGQLFIDIGIDFVLPPGISAAKSMAEAFQEFENGSKWGAAFLAGVAIIEVTPWGKVGKAISNTASAGYKSFKLFKGWKVLADFVRLRKSDEYLENVSTFIKQNGDVTDDVIKDLNDFPGDKEIFVKEIAAPLPLTGVWTLTPTERGRAIEKFFGQNLHDNFPIIDIFKDGVATSIKSTNTYAKSYADIADLKSLWTKYVDDLAKLEPTTEFAGDIVENVQKQALQIIIPDPLNQSQLQILNEVIDYAKGKGLGNTDIEILIEVFE